jgi:hypothetical protein
MNFLFHVTYVFQQQHAMEMTKNSSHQMTYLQRQGMRFGIMVHRVADSIWSGASARPHPVPVLPAKEYK